MCFINTAWICSVTSGIERECWIRIAAVSAYNTSVRLHRLKKNCKGALLFLDNLSLCFQVAGNSGIRDTKQKPRHCAQERTDVALSQADRVVSVTPEVFPHPNIPCLCAIWDGKCQLGGLAEAAVTLEVSTGTAPWAAQDRECARGVLPPVCATAPRTGTAQAAQIGSFPGKTSSGPRLIY